MGEWLRALGSCASCGCLVPVRQGLADQFGSLSLREDGKKSRALLTCLFSNQYLPGRNDAHIVDRYNYLNEKYELRTNGHLAEALPFLGRFKEEVLDTGQYEQARLLCKEVLDHETVITCDACNKGAERSGQGEKQDMLRCWRALPPGTVVHQRGNKKGVADVLLQVAVLFERGAGGVWAVKGANQVFRDFTLWKCASQLRFWGEGKGDWRALCNAVLYGSYRMWLDLEGVVSFIDWHVFIFRDWYIRTHRPGTFFGHGVQQAFEWFNVSPGCDWVEGTRLLENVLLRARRPEAAELVRMQECKRVLQLSGVSDELGLLLRHFGGKRGVSCFWRFYEHHVAGSLEGERFKEFKPELARCLAAAARR